jgi:hypothetical protein
MILLALTMTAKQKRGRRYLGKKSESTKASEKAVAECPEGKEVSSWAVLKKLKP